LFVEHGEKERAGVTDWNKGEGRKKESRGQFNNFTLQMCDWYTKQFGMLTLKQISNLLYTFIPVTSKMFDSYKSNDLIFDWINPKFRYCAKCRWGNLSIWQNVVQVKKVPKIRKVDKWSRNLRRCRRRLLNTQMFSTKSANLLKTY